METTTERIIMSGFTPQEVLSNPTTPELKEELSHWTIVLNNRLDTKIRSEPPKK
jgi:hypothetical protein